MSRARKVARRLDEAGYDIRCLGLGVWGAYGNRSGMRPRFVRIAPAGGKRVHLAGHVMGVGPSSDAVVGKTSEGFPDWTPAEFVAMFTRSMRCQPDTTVTRVEWRYPCAPAITLPPDCGWTPCEDCYLPCFRPLGHLVPHRVLATGVDRNEDDVPVDVVDQVRHRCAGPAPGGGIRPATLGWPDA